jgi:hypothetical protein
MKLIKGDDLNQEQTKQVLSAFIYRWTTENKQRQYVWSNISGQPTIPLISDEQWLKDHAFWFLDDGSRLSANHKHAELVYLV